MSKGAEEYHSADFEWHELEADILNNSSLSFHLSPFQPSSSSSSSSSSDSQAWSLFHSRHSTGKFFKERRYLLKEFPELLSCADYSNVLEVGCGNGSTVLPILRMKEKINVYACDCSAEALERAEDNLVDADVVCLAERFHPFCCDFSATEFPNWLSCQSCRNMRFKKLLNSNFEVNENEGALRSIPFMKDGSCCIGGMDFITMFRPPGHEKIPSRLILKVFTLSAVPPERMTTAIKECFSVLKPGGLLLFRDYGLYDMTMLRFKPEKRVGFRHYIRDDGTYSYFFDLDATRNLFVGVGFTELELEYCCVKSVNRKKGKSMRRVWVHGKFQKPL